MEYYLFDKEDDIIHVFAYIAPKEDSDSIEVMETVDCFIQLEEKPIGERFTELGNYIDEHVKYIDTRSPSQWLTDLDNIKKEYQKIDIDEITINTPDGSYYYEWG